MPSSAAVLIRFGLRLAVLFGFAALGRRGYAGALLSLLMMSVAISGASALLRREPLLAPVLTNWDEAAAYGCLALAVAVIHGSFAS